MSTVLTTLPALSALAAYVVIGYTVYCVGVVVYRLYLGPLCKFPGPRLAAATQWYETYYEIFYHGGGMFTKHIKKLHDEYGPIVRINPWELHIDDPDFYETIYAPSTPFDKLQVLENRFSIPTAAFSTAAHALHKPRRAALAPFFTKSKIQAHAPFIQQLVDTICTRLRDEHAGTGQPVVLNDVFSALAADVVTTLAFGDAPTVCASENWKTPFTEAMDNLVSSTHVNTQFPFMVSLTNAIPESLLIKSPAIRPVLEFRHSLNTSISRIINAHRNSAKPANGKGRDNDTVFQVLLNSKLPPAELTEERLQHEAVSIIGAGFDTTKQALTMIAFHILDNADVYRRLRQELLEAIPDPAVMPSWPELQQLPFLTACIEEGLRIGFGTVQRSPRIASTAIPYRGYTIPARTPISQDSYHMHLHEELFPESGAYRPERWLGDPRGPDGVKNLSRYMVAFGRGARMCLGMQMAYAELYMMIASMMRRLDLELYETDRSDVDFYVDWLTPHAKPDSKGVRVLVNKA
ncbi:hypothetical protein MY4824_004553 [Beauveria thailandica]